MHPLVIGLIAIPVISIIAALIFVVGHASFFVESQVKLLFIAVGMFLFLSIGLFRGLRLARVPLKKPPWERKGWTIARNGWLDRFDFRGADSLPDLSGCLSAGDSEVAAGFLGLIVLAAH